MLKNTLILICFLFIGQYSFSQDINKKIEKHYLSEEYDKAIAFKENEKELSDTGSFFIGLSYYSKSDDKNAIAFFDRAVSINPGFAYAYLYKSISLIYQNKIESAHKSIDKAINLQKDNPRFYEAKGDIFYSTGNKDSAFVYFKKATEQEDVTALYFSKLADIYVEMDSLEQALKTYTKTKLLLEEKSGKYINCLYNIGITNLSLKKYNEAEEALSEIIELDDKDYHALAKLIQCYYAQQKYKEADKLKTILYEAYEKKELPKNMKEGFCFDQFIWDGKRVMVFENYDEPKDKGLYYKHIFYVLNKKGEIDFQVQTEWSFALEMEKKEYVLGMNKGKTHFSFFQYTFDKDFSYDKLKKCAIKIMDGEVNASSSSTRN